ncbi:hypothetical protein H9L39_10266 [Fusarium oxysporum f. sp. albedinis]|nr:hypothetical protein H9L39_10266 [Fusarium oxysporum f. sp. albedinis]
MQRPLMCLDVGFDTAFTWQRYLRSRDSSGPNSRRSLHTSSNSLSRLGALTRHQGIPQPDPAQRKTKKYSTPFSLARLFG